MRAREALLLTGFSVYARLDDESRTLTVFGEPAPLSSLPLPRIHCLSFVLYRLEDIRS